MNHSRLFYFVTLPPFFGYAYTPAGDINWPSKLLHMTEGLTTNFLPPLALNCFLLFPRPLLREKKWIAWLYVPPVLIALWSIDLLIFNNAVAIATAATTVKVLRKIELANFGLYFALAAVALAFTYRRAAAAGKKQIKGT